MLWVGHCGDVSTLFPSILYYELLITYSKLLKCLHSKDCSAIETDVLYDGHHGDVTTLLQSILFHEI